jgi:hypothetical protein
MPRITSPGARTAQTWSSMSVGLSLQGTINTTGDVVARRITEALQHLDDAIRDIPDYVFAIRAPLGAGRQGPGQDRDKGEGED